MSKKVDQLHPSGLPRWGDLHGPFEKNGTRIKVLHVIEDLETGGAERVVIDLVLGLNRQDFEPMVCCLRIKGKLAYELETEKIPVFTMHKQHKIDLALLLRLRKFMRDQQIDIVHTHVFTANLWGRLAARFAHAPVVISHEHSTFMADHWLYRRLETVLSKKTDCTIAVSNQLRNLLLEKAGLREDRVRTIYNGLKISANGDANPNRKELSCALGLDKFETVIGSVGRLDARKNYGVLLKAFCALLQKRPDAGLLLAGSGSEEAKLRALAKNLNLGDRVVFAGHRNDVPALLEQMSVFCLPSRTEGISLALLEAMAAAVPVVATRVGGNPEIIIDNTCGWLVPPDDVAALSQALTEALSQGEQSVKRARNAARRVREVFSYATMVQTFETLYRELISGKSHGKRGIAVS